MITYLKYSTAIYVTFSSLIAIIFLLTTQYDFSKNLTIYLSGIILFLAAIAAGIMYFFSKKTGSILIFITQSLQLFRIYQEEYTYSICSGPIIINIDYTNIVKGFFVRLEAVDFTIFYNHNNPIHGFGINIIPLLVIFILVYISIRSPHKNTSGQ